MKLFLHFISIPNQFIGYGVHAFNLLRELQSLRLDERVRLHSSTPDVASLDVAREIIERLPDEFTVVNIILGDGKTSHQVLDQLPGRKVTYTVFETNLLPQGWQENLSRSDLVLTASHWGEEVLRVHLGRTRVGVVPEGVDPQIYHQWLRPTDGGPGHEDEGFSFLAVGKYETRKSYEELCEAFHKAFSGNRKVRLLLKCHNPFNPGYEQSLGSLISRYRGSQILIVSGQRGNPLVGIEAMANLYRSSHCFVFPSKGEGWGLPLIEAISCGTPFIATYYSGQTEYLQHCNQSFSKIQYELCRIESEDYFRFHRFNPNNQPVWAKPKIESLAMQMLNVYANWAAVRAQALENARVIHRNFSWSRAAEALIDKVLDEFLQPAQHSSTTRKITLQPSIRTEQIIQLLGKRAITIRRCVDYLNTLACPRVLELGTTRSFRSGVVDTINYQPDCSQWDWGAGCGTYVIPAMVSNAQLVTVDPSNDALTVSRKLCEPFGDRVDFIADYSTHFLMNCKEKFDLIFMDHGETSDETAELHLKDATVIMERKLLNPGGLVLIDDQCIYDNIKGKGYLSIPYLLNHGFSLLSSADSYQALLKNSQALE